MAKNGHLERVYELTRVATPIVYRTCSLKISLEVIVHLLTLVGIGMEAAFILI